MLIDFTLEFPKLPYVSPPAAEVRARSCLRREGGVLTLQIKEEIHDFFACDAAGLSLALYIPEVYAREQMMKLPHSRHAVTYRSHVARRYPAFVLLLLQVRNSHGKVVGCKMFCPGCYTNTFVLINGLNVASATSWRYAYGGNGTAIAPISCGYTCQLHVPKEAHTCAVLALPLPCCLCRAVSAVLPLPCCLCSAATLLYHTFFTCITGCNPLCPDVKDKLLSSPSSQTKLQQLREYTSGGLLGASAAGKTVAMKSLGVTFFGLNAQGTAGGHFGNDAGTGLIPTTP